MEFGMAAQQSKKKVLPVSVRSSEHFEMKQVPQKGQLC
jgi:hypothetical protein